VLPRQRVASSILVSRSKNELNWTIGFGSVD
jgi:hypothetical protein